MKLLADPENFYDIEIGVFGGGTGDPTFTIHIADESDDGLKPLCDRINTLVERGFRFTKLELTGDDIGYKVFNIEMKLREPMPDDDGKSRINYNWKTDGTHKKWR